MLTNMVLCVALSSFIGVTEYKPIGEATGYNLGYAYTPSGLAAVMNALLYTCGPTNNWPPIIEVGTLNKTEGRYFGEDRLIGALSRDALLAAFNEMANDRVCRLAMLDYIREIPDRRRFVADYLQELKKQDDRRTD